MLKNLHTVKNILNEEECRSVGKARYWWDELAAVIAIKLPDAVQETLGVLEEYKRDGWYNMITERIQSKLCLGISLCRHTSPHF